MPRAPRVFVEGGIGHVDNRVTRGERVFAEDGAGQRFVDVMREIKQRDATRRSKHLLRVHPGGRGCSLGRRARGGLLRVAAWAGEDAGPTRGRRLARDRGSRWRLGRPRREDPADELMMDSSPPFIDGLRKRARYAIMLL